MDPLSNIDPNTMAAAVDPVVPAPQPPAIPVVDVSVTPVTATVVPQSPQDPQVVTVVRGSGEMRFKKEDLAPIIKGLMIALAGAALTYASAVVLKTDFGVYTPIVVAFWSVLANAARLWISNNTKIVPSL